MTFRSLCLGLSGIDKSQSVFANRKYLLMLFLGFYILSNSVNAQSPPSNISIDSETINENQVIGTLVGNLTASDPDGDANTFELVAGTGDTDNASFSIQNGNELISAEVFDFESNDSYNIRIRVTDETANTYEEALVISVTDSNDPPTSISFNTSPIESPTLNPRLKVSGQDEDATDTLRFELVTGIGDTDNSNFEISVVYERNPNTFQYEYNSYLIYNGVFDFETTPPLQVRISAFDESGASYEQSFEIKVQDKKNTFSEWGLDASLTGGVESITATAADNNGNFYIAGFVAGSYEFENGDIVDESYFLTKLNSNLEVIWAVDVIDSLDFMPVIDIGVESNGDLYLLGDNSLNTQNGRKTNIWKFTPTLQVVWKFDASSDTSSEVDGVLSVSNGKIAYARQASFGQRFGLIPDEDPWGLGPYLENDKDALIVALIDTTGSIDWVDAQFDTRVNLMPTASDLYYDGSNIFLSGITRNWNERLVIFQDPQNILLDEEFSKRQYQSAPVNESKITLDPAGNLYYTARDQANFDEASFFNRDGQAYNSGTDGSNVIIKYNENRIFQFAKLIYPQNNDEPIYINNIIATDFGLYAYGYSTGRYIVHEGGTIDLGKEKVAFILEFNTLGVFQESYTVSGDAEMFGSDMVQSSSGDFFFTGTFRSGSVTLNGSIYTNDIDPFEGQNSNEYDADIFYSSIKEDFTINSSGSIGTNIGNLIWRDAARSLDGSIYAFGDFVGEVVIGSDTIFSNERDVILGQFLPDGTLTLIEHFAHPTVSVFANEFDIIQYEELGTGLLKENFLLAGHADQGRILNFNGVTINNDSTFLVGLNENYFGLWGNTIGGIGYYDLIADASNNLYISSAYEGTLTAGGTTYPSNSSRDAVLISYDADGTFLNVLEINSAKDEYVRLEDSHPNTPPSLSATGDTIYWSVGYGTGSTSNFTLDNINLDYIENGSLLLAFDNSGTGVWGKNLEGVTENVQVLPYGTDQLIYHYEGNAQANLLNEDGTVPLEIPNWEVNPDATYYRFGDTFYATTTSSSSSQIIGLDDQFNTELTFSPVFAPLITMLATDAGDTIFSVSEPGIELFTINSAPEDITLSNSTIEENLEVGSLVGKLSTEDNDDPNGFTYELTGTNDYFAIQNDSIVTTQSLNFEQAVENSLAIEIEAQDPSGGALTKQFLIDLLDVNDAPSYLGFSYGFADQRYYEDSTGSVISGLRIGELHPLDSVITVFSTTDEDAIDSFEYSFVTDSSGFEDYQYFEIQGDSLLPADTLDYEFLRSERAFQDQFGNTSEGFYRVLVKSTDKGGEEAYSEIRIGLLDENEPATNLYFANDQADSLLVLGYNGLISEGWTFPIALEVEDPDDLYWDNLGFYTFQLVDGEGSDDNALFEITNVNTTYTTISVKPDTTLNYEADSLLTIRLGVYDYDSTYYLEFPLTILVEDVNENPTGLLLDGIDVFSGPTVLEENLPIGTVIGQFTVVDEDMDSAFSTNELEITDGSFVDANRNFDDYFSLDEANNLIVKDTLDHEILFNPSLSYRINGGLYGDMPGSFEFTITDINEAPRIIASGPIPSLNESSYGIGFVNWNVTYNDPENELLTHELVSGEGDTDNASFEFPENTSRPSALIGFNHEEKDTLSIRIQATDPGGLFDEAIVRIAVLDQNDLPSEILLDNTEIMENQPQGTLIGTLSAIDEDEGDSHIFQLASSGYVDNVFFTINGNELLANESFDFESKNQYTIGVTTSDQWMQNFGSTTNAFEFTITVLDEDDAVVLSNNTIEENIDIGSVVGTLSIASGETSFEFFAGEGDTDNARFSIDGDQLVTSESFNYETNQSFSIRVSIANDESKVSVFDIQVLDQNDAPTAIALDATSVMENMPAGTSIGNLAAEDEDADETLTFSLSDESDFSVNGSVLETSRSFDYGSEKSFDVAVTVTDKGGLTFEDTFTITITNDPSDDQEEVVLGLDDEEIKLYPIPTSERINVTNIPAGIKQYRMYSAVGQVVLEGIISENQASISMAELSPGIYFLELGAQQHRIVKIKTR